MTMERIDKVVVNVLRIAAAISLLCFFLPTLSREFFDETMNIAGYQLAFGASIDYWGLDIGSDILFILTLICPILILVFANPESKGWQWKVAIPAGVHILVLLSATSFIVEDIGLKMHLSGWATINIMAMAIIMAVPWTNMLYGYLSNNKATNENQHNPSLSSNQKNTIQSTHSIWASPTKPLTTTTPNGSVSTNLGSYGWPVDPGREDKFHALLTVSAIMRIVAIVILLGGFLLGLTLASYFDNFWVFLISLLSGGLIALMLFVVVELINVLLGIYKKMHASAQNSYITLSRTNQALNEESNDNGLQDGSKAIMKRLSLLLEDGDWRKVDEIVDRELDKDPENTRLYVSKLCAKLELNKVRDLSKIGEALKDEPLYQRALQFSSDKEKATLENYALPHEIRIKQAQLVRSLMAEVATLTDANKVYDVYSSMESELPPSFRLLGEQLKAAMNLYTGTSSASAVINVLKQHAAPYLNG